MLDRYYHPQQHLCFVRTHFTPRNPMFHCFSIDRGYCHHFGKICLSSRQLTPKMSLMPLYTSSTSKKSHKAASSHISVISKPFTPFWRSFNVISRVVIFLLIEWAKLLQASNLLKIIQKLQDPSQQPEECTHQVPGHFSII